jgi:hypothetical protein
MVLEVIWMFLTHWLLHPFYQNLIPRRQRSLRPAHNPHPGPPAHALRACAWRPSRVREPRLGRGERGSHHFVNTEVTDVLSLPHPALRAPLQRPLSRATTSPGERGRGGLTFLLMDRVMGEWF